MSIEKDVKKLADVTVDLPDRLIEASMGVFRQIMPIVKGTDIVFPPEFTEAAKQLFSTCIFGLTFGGHEKVGRKLTAALTEVLSDPKYARIAKVVEEVRNAL